MTTLKREAVLAEIFASESDSILPLKRMLLVVLGIAALAVAAKIKIPMWPSPVPITMGTFAVLTIGAAYGPRLGLTTIMGYMIIGALGFNVFANSSAASNGLSYMTGATGGYLAGYVLATLALGWAARRGWDRSVPMMALAMLIGNALIYVPGLLWLARLHGWEKAIEWGLVDYLVGDAAKLALATLLLPGAWRFLGRARV